MATKTNIDFHRVEEKHADIHTRLQNWAQWCNGRESGSISPMFRLYRSPARARGAESSWSGVPVNGPDAARIARYVGQLPEKHRKSLNWCYLKPVNPRRAASDLAVTLEGLALLLRDARQMLINRRA